MGWCNGPSMPRWPSWSERRALMMLNYVNIILNRLFNEVTGFADQHTATLGPNIPPVPSLWTQPLCDNIKHFNGLNGPALLHLPWRWENWNVSDFIGLVLLLNSNVPKAACHFWWWCHCRNCKEIFIHFARAKLEITISALPVFRWTRWIWMRERAFSWS